MGQHSRSLIDTDTLEIQVVREGKAGRHRKEEVGRHRTRRNYVKDILVSGGVFISAGLVLLGISWWTTPGPQGPYTYDAKKVAPVPTSSTVQTPTVEASSSPLQTTTVEPTTTTVEKTTTVKPKKTITTTKAKPIVMVPLPPQPQTETQVQVPPPAASTTTSQSAFCNSQPSCSDYVASKLDASQTACLDNIIIRESNWNVSATNSSSGAYGIPQALPGSKMANAGTDWQTNGVTQINWMIGYVNSVYGSACGAWSFWQSHGSY